MCLTKNIKRPLQAANDLVIDSQFIAEFQVGVLN